MKATSKILLALGLLLVTTGVGFANGHVVINELKVKGTEYIELFNNGAAPVDVTNWTLDDGTGPEVLNGVVPAGGFLVVNSTLGLSNSGAVVELRDASGALIDDVGYGNQGGAPLGFNSIGRSPDGDDTDDWARDFEYLDDNLIAGAETPGAANLQGSPALGSGVLINEIDWQKTNSGPGDFDAIEIYNPTNAPVSIQGYWVSDGDGFCQIVNPIVVPAGGWVVLTNGSPGEGLDCGGFDTVSISGSDVMYLYRDDPQGSAGFPVRIDQLGIDVNSPGAGLGETYQRCTDGAGPNDGFDYPSSGGGVTYFSGNPTLGGTNNGTCAVPTEESTWGRVKGLYR